MFYGGQADSRVVGEEDFANAMLRKKARGPKPPSLRTIVGYVCRSASMSEAELIFTALAELSTRQIAESVDATGMAENQSAAKSGGRKEERT